MYILRTHFSFSNKVLFRCAWYIMRYIKKQVYTHHTYCSREFSEASHIERARADFPLLCARLPSVRFIIIAYIYESPRFCALGGPLDGICRLLAPPVAVEGSLLKWPRRALCGRNVINVPNTILLLLLLALFNRFNFSAHARTHTPCVHCGALFGCTPAAAAAQILLYILAQRRRGI